MFTCEIDVRCGCGCRRSLSTFNGVFLECRSRWISGFRCRNRSVLRCSRQSPLHAVLRSLLIYFPLSTNSLRFEDLGSSYLKQRVRTLFPKVYDTSGLQEQVAELGQRSNVRQENHTLQEIVGKRRWRRITNEYNLVRSELKKSFELVAAALATVPKWSQASTTLDRVLDLEDDITVRLFPK
jgi:hypothetical protein